ncbi:MAG: hypothetical protein CL762_01670 [Chloroflexi bacterium]|nr:hypothetical protein [Chloroflexota bacterium]|tara:strand:- start:8227 stop:8874 length:648 start_codon:yes stop_codon:yes gene_type:complete
MILVCTKEDLRIEDSLELSGLKLTDSPGEMEIYVANSRILRDEILLFKCNESKVRCRVGIKWSLDNFKEISSSVFIGLIDPINSSILKNHILIATKLSNIDQPELEWSKEIITNSIKINSKQQKIIRYAIHKSNLDFLYGEIVSLNRNNYSNHIIDELKSLSDFDGINNLCFTVNEILISKNINTYNILIGNPKEYSNSKKIEFKNLFKNLNLDN